MTPSRHIVVIGSGIAGLTAALRLCQTYDVTLVTKLELMESNTRWAQGGIAAAMSEEDSVAEHIADTIRAGAGLCDPEAVQVLCSEGPARITELLNYGVEFDRSEGKLSLGLEAAHSRPRVLHARGDATGLSIETALVRAVRRSTIRVLEHTFACAMVIRNGAVTGLSVVNHAGERDLLDASTVILASGGAGQLYRHTTNPLGATGDGVALAFRAGAEISDVEFFQFHPTALATPDTFLISEAVRGEGAILLNSRAERFMQGIHPNAELAPRDVVARSIARQMGAEDGTEVVLDARHLGGEFLARRFPSINAASRARGFDWSTTPLPVTPAAHYWMGGVKTDVWGRTSVRGLFAVGEVACTGVHGANRLASNSLLESLVFASRTAELLMSQAHETESAWPSLDTSVQPLSVSVRGSDGAVLQDRLFLQTLMWNAAGLERTSRGLEEALKQLNDWRVEETSIEGLETANLLDVGRLVVMSAITRSESRGAHYRLDFPESISKWQHSIVLTAGSPC